MNRILILVLLVLVTSDSVGGDTRSEPNYGQDQREPVREQNSNQDDGQAAKDVIIERPYKDTYHETIIEVDNTRRYSGDYYGSTSSGEGSNLFGVILLLAAVAALVYMEKEHVKKKHVYNQMKKDVIEAEPTMSEGNNGKLVHATGNVRPLENHELRDQQFPFISTIDATELTRKVEMYQWTETIGNTTRVNTQNVKVTDREYKYETKWVDHKVESYTFHIEEGHRNPSWDSQLETYSTRTPSTLYLAPYAYEIDHDFLNQINYGLQMKNLQVTEADKREVRDRLGFDAYCDQDYLYLSKQPSVAKNVMLAEVGDYRITFNYKPSEVQVSVLAVQQDAFLTPYKKGIKLISNGNRSANQMIDDRIASADGTLLAVRICSGIAFVIGLFMLL